MKILQTPPTLTIHTTPREIDAIEELEVEGHEVAINDQKIIVQVNTKEDGFILGSTIRALGQPISITYRDGKVKVMFRRISDSE